ncbi:NAD-binding protein [Marasmius fiardii PR-910]|nr:NAD-binding protein [Marasmius fiardii PR-910]
MSTQSTAKPVVLITGATGYVGGSVLTALLDLPNANSQFEFRAIVRNVDKARKLNELFGVKPIIGSHSDQDFMSKQVAEVDVVIALADCDDVGAAEGVLKGLKRRFENTGKAPILIHNSGTGVLWNQSKEDGAEGLIWDDEDVTQFDTIHPDAFHRPSELKVLEADREGYVKTYIVCPGIIYDIARNPLVEAGIANAATIIFKSLVPLIIKRSSGVLPLDGKNRWPNVHISDLANFYALLFNSVLTKDIPHGQEGYFFLGADEHKYYDVYNRMSQALFDLGKIQSPVPTPFSKQEAEEHFGDGGFFYSAMASDVRCVSNRAKKLGWKPTKTTNDFLDTIPREVGYVLNLPTQ